MKLVSRSGGPERKCYINDAIVPQPFNISVCILDICYVNTSVHVSAHFEVTCQNSLRVSHGVFMTGDAF
jgi:hypothetical protein